MIRSAAPTRANRSAVLVVEDEPAVRETIAERLRGEGLEVESAADGEEGLTLFRRRRPDLIVLDLMLPSMSGADLCRVIRAASDVPIVILSAHSSPADIVRGLELGADDYVTKPFSLRELRDRVIAQLLRAERRNVARSVHALGLNGLRLDLDGHRIMRGGVPVPVTPRAFELLAFLAMHPGRVFTREQLLDEVWGSSQRGDPRTVDVHVRALRLAIEPDPGAPQLLETVRGVGYVLRAAD